MTAVSRLTPCRVQNFVCTVPVSDLLSATPTIQRSTLLATRRMAMNASDRISLRPFSALIPTQSMPKKRTSISLRDPTKSPFRPAARR